MEVPMIALRILELKDFTSKLFLGDVFHRFYFIEGSFTTFLTQTLDGALQKDFYDNDSRPERNFCYWEEIKPYCYSIIRGKRSPLRFRIVFQLSDENTAKMLHQSGLSLKPDDIHGLYLNCQFQDGKLLCTTGTSLKIFSLDKSLDRLWDDLVKKFFKQQGILFEEV